MPWQEFRDFLVGIAPDTPLGRVVAIRAEKNKDVLKQFSKEQLKIRNDWQKRKVKKVSQGEMEDILTILKKAFLSMSDTKR